MSVIRGRRVSKDRRDDTMRPKPSRSDAPPSGALLSTGAVARLFGVSPSSSASLALLRFTRGPVGAALLLGLSGAFWLILPAALAARRLERADL